MLIVHRYTLQLPGSIFSIVITLQTYAHALPQDDAEAADRIAAAFE
jgi:hypothetical protein